MYSNTVVLMVGLVIFSLVKPTRSIAEDNSGAKELKQLEGVWVSTPAKKGRDRGHIIAFRDGKMSWRSFQTQDGEAIIGHDKLYDILLDSKMSPRHITATLDVGQGQETRRGIYELQGDMLKIAFSSDLDGKRPVKFEDEGAQIITLTRDKKVKVPDLSKGGKRGKETSIEPSAKWFGRVRDATVVKQLPEKPITTGAEFEKVWKALQREEEVPKVDFAKEFVLVRISTSAKMTAIGLIVSEGEEQVYESISVEAKAGEKIEGFTFAIGVFRRELVDVVDGRIVAKRVKQ